MKNKMKLKRYGRRALALLSCFAVVLPMALAPVSGEELTSQDITSKVVNGQLAIFEWKAVHYLDDLKEGMHYVFPLLVGDRVWCDAETKTIKNDDGDSWAVKTYPISDARFSFLNGRKFNYNGHPGDVFFTVGNTFNPVVISRVSGYDSTNHGPMVSVWITDTYDVDAKDANGNTLYEADGKTPLKTKETRLWPMQREVDKYGVLEDMKNTKQKALEHIYDGGFYERYYDQYTDKEQGKREYKKFREEWEATLYRSDVFFQDFAQSVAAQRSSGQNLLKPWDSKVSKWCLCYYDGDDKDEEDRVKGQFSLTYEWTGPNPSIRYRPGNYDYYVMGEDESLWDWRIRMNLWDGVPTMYSTLTQSYEIGDGQTLSLNAEEGFNGVYIPKAMKLVVQRGGTLSISENVYNDGTIINNGGTIVVQAGGSLVNLGVDGRNELVVNEGDFIIMPETRVNDKTFPAGRVYINPDHPMTLINSRLINFGYLILGGDLNLYGSFLENRTGGVIAGNMRFGDKSTTRFYYCPWNKTQKKYVRDNNQWIEFDNITKEFIKWSGKFDWDDFEDLSYDYLMEYVEDDDEELETEIRVREKKEFIPYFQTTNLEVLKNVNVYYNRPNQVPNQMIDWKDYPDSSTRAKVHLYDTQAHFNTYGCITVEEGSTVVNLDIGQPGRNTNDLDFKVMSKEALATKIDQVSGGLNLTTDNAGNELQKA